MTADYLMAGLILLIVAVVSIAGALYGMPINGGIAWLVERARKGADKTQQKRKGPQR